MEGDDRAATRPKELPRDAVTAPTFRVTVNPDTKSGRTVTIGALDPGRLCVGQSSACELVIDDNTVSRRHLSLEVVSSGPTFRAS